MVEGNSAAPAATETEKKTRGPMSEDARIVQAKRKILALPLATRKLITDAVAGDDGNSDLADVAQIHDDVSRVLEFAAPLSGDGRRTLLALVAPK